MIQGVWGTRVVEETQYFPPDVWAKIFSFSLPPEQATLRLVCTSACTGADSILNFLSVDEDLWFRFNRRTPSSSEILKMMRRLTGLSKVFIRCHSRNSFFMVKNVVEQFEYEKNKKCILSGAYIDGLHLYKLKLMRNGNITLSNFAAKVRKEYNLYLVWTLVNFYDISDHVKKSSLFVPPTYVTRSFHFYNTH